MPPADPQRRRAHRTVAAVSVALILIGLVTVPAAIGQGIPAPTGTIAYLEGRERIRLVEADGTDDRVIFGLTPDATTGIQAVAWRPDGQRLAFSSGHEELCSVWVADLYLVDPDGTHLSRLTNGPACAELAALPEGTVRLTVENRLPDVGEYLLYVQGMESALAVLIEPGFQATYELPVRDLGEDTPQFAVAMNASSRWFDPAVYADVRPGEVTDAGTLVVSDDGFDTWGALSASWSHDGTRLAYQQGLGSLWQVDAAAGQLDIGRTLFEADVNGTIAATSPTWSPVEDRVLYSRYDTGSPTIDLGRPDADRVGDPIMGVTLANGIDWLPDGTGFVISDSAPLLDSANLFLADLTTGAVEPLTSFTSGFALWPTVSPDGRFVAYSYSAVPLDEATALELRVRHLGTGQERVLAANGLNPDWGP